MTDNEIKKALECCTSNRTTCEKCPCFGAEIKDKITCELKMTKNALDLINRQQAEIERYKETYGCYPVWNVPCENVFVLSMSCDDYEDFKNQLKAEAIKEFANEILSPFERQTYLSKRDLETIVKNLAKYY
jgi:tRNA isopentenyl-2-thiomethyl-A-37 hydroxylase MiaE